MRCNMVSIFIERFGKYVPDNYPGDEILVRYSEQEIYKSGYTSFNTSIATQTLQYKTMPKDYFLQTSFTAGEVEANASDTLQTILDEEYPLVLCMVGGKSQVKILEKEIQWITRITRTLENCLGATSQKDFWGSSTEDGQFGIIAPHHAHISRIKDALAGGAHGGFKAPWTEKREDIYVGTVDKLQGKERQAVVVSYGVGDIEQAIGEGEFIYSRNRLNVSLTRGKQKNIVFLTEALLNFPIEALGIDNREILEGISFLCGFKNFMSQQEVDTSVDIRTFKSDIDDTEITVFRKKVN